VRQHHPPAAARGPVTFFWYDGGDRPSPEIVGMENVPDSGFLLIGSEASIGTGALSPSDERFASIPRTLRRPGDMYAEWLAGIRQGNPAAPSCPFDYAGPLTEAYLLGNIALKTGRKLQWDATNRRFVNDPEADACLTRRYRPGWEPGSLITHRFPGTY